MTWNTGRAALAMGAFLVCGIALSAQQPSPQRLTLNDAITLALKNNLSLRVAGTQVSEAEGARDRQHAALLPRVTGDSLANLQNRNLAVLGVSVPGIPAVVGPFSYYDFRVTASQTLVDRHSYHNWKASQSEEQATKLDYQDARDLVIRQTAGFYLDGEAALAEVQAADSRVITSEALEKLAQDQHTNQLATAVDVVRAQVQLARDRQSLARGPRQLSNVSARPRPLSWTTARHSSRTRRAIGIQAHRSARSGPSCSCILGSTAGLSLAVVTARLLGGTTKGLTCAVFSDVFS